MTSAATTTQTQTTTTPYKTTPPFITIITYIVHREELRKGPHLWLGPFLVVAAVHEHVVLAAVAVQIDVPGDRRRQGARGHSINNRND